VELSDRYTLIPEEQPVRLASEIRKFIDETQTRAFSARFAKRMKNGAVPTMPQAGVYAVVMHYLKAAVALNGGLGDGVAVVNKMKDIPTDDLTFRPGKDPHRRS
jgi:hypothetical protein